MHHLSTSQVQNIISQLKAGHSTRQIALKIGVSHSSVSRVRDQHCSDLSLPSPGRPKKLSVRDVNHGIRQIMSKKVDNATEVAKTLQDITNQPLSAQTVRRELKKAGMKAVVKKRKPLLKPRHKRARLQWAEVHKHWTLEDWKRVVWSDEAKVNRLGSDGRKWVWKKSNEGLNDRCIEETMKFGGGSLMVWSCMLWDGPGYLVKIDGGLDAELYCKILDEDLNKSLKFYRKNPKNVIFQQDNDPKHKSKKAMELLKKQPFELMEWPAQSPDLNPIEHLWSHFKNKLGEFETPPASIHELWTRMEAEWEKITPSVCQNLIESMPRRVTAVIKAKGGHTKY